MSDMEGERIHFLTIIYHVNIISLCQLSRLNAPNGHEDIGI